MTELKICRNCQSQFEITNADLEFYASVSPVFNGQKYLIFPPTFCPDCRQQRRLAWRNQMHLYKRTCDGSGEKLTSSFHPDNPVKIYKNDYWYSDKWDPKDYARDFDFSRPFLEQYAELIHAVPQLAIETYANENSEYTNQCSFSKNCYLVFESNENENCYYSSNIYECTFCVDCYYITKSELCYQCLDCTNCYALQYSRDCSGCSNSYFLQNCLSCKNCFGCLNLKNKEYYFFNQALSKEEYEQKLQEYQLESYTQIQSLKEHFAKIHLQFPHKYYHGKQNENSVGDYLDNTQNCQFCFDTMTSQDSKFLYNCMDTKNTYDMSVFGLETEFCYDNHSIADGARNILFSDQVWTGVYDILYSRFCIHNSHHLFGCVALKHSSYCILNKQYTKEEYEKLVPRIIEHMKKNEEWGEFIPIKYSIYAYNETEANDQFPLNETESQAKGYPWRDKDSQSSFYQIPDKINEVEDSILQETLVCQKTHKKYKIISQELDFYRQNRIPIPREDYASRYQNYIAQRNKRTLFNRQCLKCQAPIQTTYSPDQPEIVYCEQCYLDSLY